MFRWLSIQIKLIQILIFFKWIGKSPINLNIYNWYVKILVSPMRKNNRGVIFFHDALKECSQNKMLNKKVKIQCSQRSENTMARELLKHQYKVGIFCDNENQHTWLHLQNAMQAVRWTVETWPGEKCPRWHQCNHHISPPLSTGLEEVIHATWNLWVMDKCKAIDMLYHKML